MVRFLQAFFFSVLVLISAPAKALLIFTDQVAFLTAAEPDLFENFEGTIFDDPNLLTSIDTPLFSVTTTPTGSGVSHVFCCDASGNVPPTDGTGALIAGSITNNAWTLSFDLFAPITAIGFHVTDYGDHGSGQLLFSNSIGETAVIAQSPLSDMNVLFFGLISDGVFDQFAVQQTALGDGVGFDQVALRAVSVPEPSTLFLFGIGLATLGLLGWRRRRNRLGARLVGRSFRVSWGVLQRRM